MKINYIWLVIIIIIIFMVNKHINKNEQQNVSNDKGDVNKQTISPLKKTIRDAIIKLNELSPLKIKDLSTEDNPVKIVKGDSLFCATGITNGDLMIICDVGAYGMVLSSNYNLRPASPEILVKGLKTIVIKKRQKITDLI